MRKSAIYITSALLIAGCTTTGYDPADLPNKDTRTLCRIVAENQDQNYRKEAAKLLTRRGATVNKCIQLIQADNAMAAAATVAAGAALAASAGSSYGGGYYPSYGAEWDQFYNEYYQLIWRCRARSTGRFVDNSYCSGKPMIDTTWPGWSA